MSSQLSPAVTLHNVTYEWPDGSVALDSVSGTFLPGRTGLIGRNGSGKSTLLRLIAGELSPTDGTITRIGDVAYLPQTLTLNTATTVADLLGITNTIAALQAIEQGDVAEHYFDTIGDDWDIETRAMEQLHSVGLSNIALHRSTNTLSGGQVMIAALTGLRLRTAPITLLDEPTNNLDRSTRRHLYRYIENWPGTLVVVSHDPALLEIMGTTTELRAGTLTTFGGPYSAWSDDLAAQQAAAEQAARTAKNALKVEKKQRIEAETQLARRAAQGRKAATSMPPIIAGGIKRKAEATAGATRQLMDSRIASAKMAVEAAQSLLRDDEAIHLTLPDPDVPRSRRIAQLHDAHQTIHVQGPERVALVGPNGVGKTRFLQHLVHRTEPMPGGATGELLIDRVGYLPQRLMALEDNLSALDNIAPYAPHMTVGELRNQCARLLLRGDTLLRPVGSLSGGERFRVHLARLLFAQPPAQLLILDEPTNNLDMDTVTQLVDALAEYRGALLVVSHDDGVLDRLGITMTVEMTSGGGLRVMQ